MKRTGIKRAMRPQPIPYDADVSAEQRQARMREMLDCIRFADRPESTYGGTTTGPIAKETPAKPGKGRPTAEEREWMDAIVAYGCVACRIDGLGYRRPAVHHILRGGVRMGHLFTLPLCDPGHHQNGKPQGMVSRHPWKAQFERQYGSEMFLLGKLRLELCWKSDSRVRATPDGASNREGELK